MFGELIYPCEGANAQQKVLLFVLPYVTLAELPQKGQCLMQQKSSSCSRCQFDCIFQFCRTTFLELPFECFVWQQQQQLKEPGSVYVLFGSPCSGFVRSLADEKLRLNVHVSVSQSHSRQENTPGFCSVLLKNMYCICFEKKKYLKIISGKRNRSELLVILK